MLLEDFILSLINTSTFILVGLFFAYKVLNEQFKAAYLLRMSNPKTSIKWLFKLGHFSLYFALGLYFIVILIGYLAVLVELTETIIPLLFLFFSIAVILSIFVIAILLHVSNLDNFESNKKIN